MNKICTCARNDGWHLKNCPTLGGAAMVGGKVEKISVYRNFDASDSQLKRFGRI